MQPTGRTCPELRSGAASLEDAAERRFVGQHPDRPQLMRKVLKPQLAAALGTERFLREITFTARLDHAHILPLLDSGEAGGLLSSL